MSASNCKSHLVQIRNLKWPSEITYLVLTIQPLSATMVVFNPFYELTKSLLLGTKLVFKHQI